MVTRVHTYLNKLQLLAVCFLVMLDLLFPAFAAQLH